MSEEKTYCHWHKKEETALQCGRCEKYICHRCAIVGPVGARCPECGKGETHFRPAAVLLGVKRLVTAPFQGGSIWRYVIFFVIISVVFRGCMVLSRPDPVEQDPAAIQRALSDESEEFGTD